MLRFALVGNPNSGKTTLFNALTGSTAHVGNYPGITVEKKEGEYKKLAEKVQIVDLPGIYSLSPYSPEEVVARNVLLDEKIDGIINIVDATNLERNLYLSTQLIELDIPVIIALNMSDVVQKLGDVINLGKLEKSIGVPVVEISALKKSGITNLMEIAYRTVKGKAKTGISPLSSSKFADIIDDIKAKYADIDKKQNLMFHAVKMFEGDSVELEKYPKIAEEVEKIKEKIDASDFEDDYEGIVADIRYRYITDHCVSVVKKQRKTELTKADKADKVLTHKIWGIPIFLLIMLFVFHSVFTTNFLFIGSILGAAGVEPASTEACENGLNLFTSDEMTEGMFGTEVIQVNGPGSFLVAIIDNLVGLVDEPFAGWAEESGTWYSSLLYDGLWGGITAILGFVPLILLLYLFLVILEDVGYMARVAFILDRAFRRFGLSGKSFVPLLMCFGCAVPGIAATRTLENENERRRTIMVTPFMSCGAKLPIWAAFGGVLANNYSGWSGTSVSAIIYILGIVIAIGSAIFLNKTIVKGKTPPFIMELPAYHFPQFKNVAIRLWDKLKGFIKRASTIIAGAIIVIWFLQNFSWSWEFGCDTNMSILYGIGNFFAPLFIPLGFGYGSTGWIFVVATITGLLAKEVVVTTIGQLGGVQVGDALEDIDPNGLDPNSADIGHAQFAALLLTIGGGMFGGIEVIPAMFAFMAFNLLAVPCMAAVAQAKVEFRVGNDPATAKKYLWQSIAFWSGTAYIVSLFIYWFGVLWGVSLIGGIIVSLILLTALITYIALDTKGIINQWKNNKSNKKNRMMEEQGKAEV